MFLKPFRIKTQSAVKNSDRKKLRNEVRSQYPSLTEENAQTLIPNKEEMNVTKVSTSGGDIVQIYFLMKNPIFYETYRRLYPTVYTLWQCPDLVPAFRTWPPVFEKLQKGADLMLPGVICDQQHSPKMFGALRKGDVVSVTIAGNRSPVALGHALLSGEDMYMSGLRGKGVGIFHILGDTLWEAGDKSHPPLLPEHIPDVEQFEQEGTEDGEQSGMPNMENLKVEDESSNDKDDTSPQYGDKNNDDDDEEEESDPVAEMDELLHFCFACAIKSRIKKTDLPMLTVNLMRDFMQPFSPSKRLDIKKSSFKKLNKFLQQKVSEGYITTKQPAKGVDTITSFDNTHPRLKDVDVPEAVEEEGSAEVAGSSEEDVNKPLTFTDVYCVNGATAELFKAARLSKGDALKCSDVRESVLAYIKDNNLLKQDKRTVTLDPILAHLILRQVEGDLDHMPIEQVVNRVQGKMQPGVAISTCDGLLTIKKGKVEPIKLDVSMRASNKKVTIVENLEEYAFDVKAFARTVQRSVACSCSVVQSDQKNKGPIVQVQGNQINFIAGFLLDKCKIPKKYIVGLDKAPKQKKKR